MKKTLCLVLCLLMMVQIMPVISFAAYEDGAECWYCGHYHWDEYLCECGACSIDCTNSTCWYETHCKECGACLSFTYFCSECGLCEDCFMNLGYHCMECRECRVSDEDEMCKSCLRCSDCVSICDVCGYCEECIEGQHRHCPECNNCYLDVSPCHEFHDHCSDCCIVCEQCGHCYYEDGIDLCDYCLLCPDCCLENATDAGCVCGEYCIESSDWDEHICPECETPFCVNEQCDICGLCIDCCASNSECIDYMCVEDDDYEEHFCLDCGACFHSVEQCESCAASGELRCVDCCRELLHDLGCDCDDRCINDDDIDEHLQTAHAAAIDGHSAKPQEAWSANERYHWHECRLCNDDEHNTSINPHSYDIHGVCRVCGYDSLAKILITMQPRSTLAKVSVDTIDYSDPLCEINNLVTFSTAAQSSGKLKYRWYIRAGEGMWRALNDEELEIDGDYYPTVDGAYTNTLRMSVPRDACYADYSVRCEISDSNGNKVYTNPAVIKASHVYNVADSIYSGSGIKIYTSNGIITAYPSVEHEYHCAGDNCEAVKYKTAAHVFDRSTKTTITDTSGVVWIVRICKECGYKRYSRQHEHSYDNSEIDYTYDNPYVHRVLCDFEGCDEYYDEQHEWSAWKNQGTPYTDTVGRPYRECIVCGHWSPNKPQVYDEAAGKMVNADWTRDNNLIQVDYGYANSDLAKGGDTIIIGFSPSNYAKKEFIKKENPLCTGWKVVHYSNVGGIDINVDVTILARFTRIEGDATWSVTLPQNNGGMFIFTPIIADYECPHNGETKVTGAKEPHCVVNGYTGNTVCCDCGGVIKYGEYIPGTSEHIGTLVPIKGTSCAATCSEHGYEGDFRCSECGLRVKGRITPKAHGTLSEGTAVIRGAKAATCSDFGFSGDTYCLLCGNKTRSGRDTLPDRNAHTDSDSDTYCDDCGEYLGEGIIHLEFRGVNAPEEGRHPELSLYPTASGYSIKKNDPDGLYWYDETEQRRISASDTFIVGHEYTLNVLVGANYGHYFIVDTDYNPAVTASLGNKLAKVFKEYDHAANESVYLRFEYGECSERVIKVGKVNVETPVAGHHPTRSAGTDGTGYCVHSVTWYEVDGDNLHYLYPEETVFELGKEYQASIWLSVEDGHEFLSYPEKATAMVNGVPCDAEFVSSTMLEVVYSFTATAERITSIDALIGAPAAGEGLSFVGSVRGGQCIVNPEEEIDVYSHGIYWYDETASMPAMGTVSAERGHVYRAYIRLVPNDGYEFAVDASGNPAVSATINGQTATVRKYGSKNAKNEIMVFVTFDECKVRPAIDTVTVRDGGVDVALSGDVELGSRVIVAAYSPDGALIAISRVMTYTGKNDYDFGMDVPHDATVKVFLWDGFDLTPVCESK